MLFTLLLAGLASGTGAPGDTVSARDITVGTGEIVHVWSSGAGAPVVLVPGLFGSAFGYRRLVGPLIGDSLSCLGVRL